MRSAAYLLYFQYEERDESDVLADRNCEESIRIARVGTLEDEAHLLPSRAPRPAPDNRSR